MNNKLCSKCKQEIREDNHNYCKKCHYLYNKQYTKDNQHGNYIYMLVGLDNQTLYIGSTTNLSQRISSHITLKTPAGVKLDKEKLQFNIMYAKIEQELTREELYYIEYYLIHKHYVMFHDTPLANDRHTFNTDIADSRQLQLIMLTETLKYCRYDVIKHKKNAFISS